MSTCRLYLDYGCIRKLTTNVVVLCGLERYLSVVMFESEITSKTLMDHSTGIVGPRLPLKS